MIAIYRDDFKDDGMRDGTDRFDDLLIRLNISNYEDVDEIDLDFEFYNNKECLSK